MNTMYTKFSDKIRQKTIKLYISTLSFDNPTTPAMRRAAAISARRSLVLEWADKILHATDNRQLSNLPNEFANMLNFLEQKIRCYERISQRTLITLIQFGGMLFS